MKSPDISVIIPAYNGEAFLRECLDSVAAQEFGDFEAIVVDDGSSDSTASIAEEFVKRDTRFRLVRLPSNCGLSGARNAGIRQSRGNYLFFLDCDDCISPSALRIMKDEIVNHKADIAISRFFRGKVFRPSLPDRYDVVEFDSREAVRMSLYQKLVMSSACAVLYKRTTVEEAGAFRPGIWYEDLDAFYRIFGNAVKIIYISAPLYFYRRNSQSFINNWSARRLDVLDVTDRILEYFSDNDPGLKSAAADRRFSAHYNIWLLMKRNGIRNEEALKRCRKVIRNGRRQALKDPEVRLKNKLGALLSYILMP